MIILRRAVKHEKQCKHSFLFLVILNLASIPNTSHHPRIFLPTWGISFLHSRQVHRRQEVNPFRDSDPFRGRL